MKKLDWTAVTASNGLVFEEQTFEHINNGHKDSYIAFVKANIPSAWHTGKLVILYGCVATGTNPGIRTLTEGAVYYNGEIYQVSSASFTTVNPQIGVWTLVDVDSGTDESTIKTATSSFLEHVLVNSKFVFAAGNSGTGTFDENSSNVVSYISGIYDTISMASGIFSVTTYETGATTYSTIQTLITDTPSATKSNSNLLVCFSGEVTSATSSGVTTRVRLKKNGTEVFTQACTPELSGQSVISFSTIISYTASDVLTITVEASASNSNIKNYQLISKSLF